MSESHGRMERVTKRKPCAVCEHDTWCMRGETMLLCMRVKSDKPKELRDGSIGYLHPTGTAPQQPAFVAPRKPRETDAAKHNAWAPKARAWRRNQLRATDALADKLGVAKWALDELCVGWDGSGWTFPEKNGAGLIVGVKRRLLDGAKVYHLGSRAGLTYSDTFADCPGPILVVEGGSDVAAGITLGLATVGRPSNTGGVPYLVRLLGPLAGRRVVVVAERDGKEGQPQDEWPGVVGAKSVCQRLRERLRQRVAWRFTPDNAKDLRAWLNATGVDVANTEACFRLGASLARRL